MTVGPTYLTALPDYTSTATTVVFLRRGGTPEAATTRQIEQLILMLRSS